MNLGFYSYLGAAIAYGLFAFLLSFSWRESTQGKLLTVSMVISACWALTAVNIALHHEAYLFTYRSFEIFRYIILYVFLLKLFESGAVGVESQSNRYQKFVRCTRPQCVGLATLLLCNEIISYFYSFPGQYITSVIGMMALSLIGLVVVEQLFRNTSMRHQWATKYLFVGIGGIFAYDFYMYSDALLFRSVDQDLWVARGVVHILAVPMLIISSARIKNWSLNIFVSRDIVLGSTVVLGGGLYLLIMTGAGYYIREFGGSWGEVIRVIFFILASILLFATLSSIRLRAQIKVFLGKHFYKNKYDYRIEWLRLTEDLSDTVRSREHYRTAIKAMAHIVDARAGLLWLRD
ncbi:MAG: PEP-CTERM system histidine kinase PrsK, partial [Proteobacteria bacterium]|nr:PEP-CTERM system histidine kinase PrsK [Pseudomonadota bacterium]